MKFQGFNRNFGNRTARLGLFVCGVLMALAPLAELSAARTPTDPSPDQIKHSKTVLKRARKDVRKGRVEEAERTIRELVALQPGNSAARLDLARLLLKQRRLVEAYEISYDTVKADKDNSFGFAVLGNVLLAAGDLRQARLLLTNALMLNEKEPLALAGLGLVDFYENRIAGAVEKLEAAAFLDPSEPDFAFSLGQVAARGERYALAAEAYRRFLDIAPATERDRRERIEGLIRFLRFLGGKQSLYGIDGRGTKVPIEIIKDRPVITVRVNGRRDPLKFVLDTGSGISVISTRTAEAFGIKPVTKGGTARAIGGSGRFPIVYGFVRSFEIGEVRVRNVPVYIRPFHESNEHLDGYIGLAVISKFLTTVDYPASEFVLRGKDGAEASAAPPGESFPLRLTSSGFLSGEVSLEGVEEPLNFIVDTGASISVISPEVARLDALGKHVADERLRVIGAAGVLDDVRAFRLPKLSLGPGSVENVRAVELDLAMINEASGFRQSGILGGNFLRNYRMTFDFRNARVLLSRAPAR